MKQMLENRVKDMFDSEKVEIKYDKMNSLIEISGLTVYQKNVFITLLQIYSKEELDLSSLQNVDQYYNYFIELIKSKRLEFVKSTVQYHKFPFN